MKYTHVLVAPLDWGLGHATRCIPVIAALLQRGCRVTVGGSGDGLMIIRKSFPSLMYIELSPYRPRYSSSSTQVWTLLVQIARFAWTIMSEHRQVKRAIRMYGIDLVISDNRFGCWSSAADCIFITHQLDIIMPPGLRWASSLVRKINYAFVKKYTCCWVPDWPGEDNLTGVLSHSLKAKRLKPMYIGPLSRMQRLTDETSKDYDVLVILSGPEPQRTHFEEIMLKVLSTLSKSKRVCLVRGKQQVPPLEVKNMMVIDFPDTQQLNALITRSHLIISRSGYSTIMDLCATGGKAVFVPTPGQTEQEYLATLLEKRGIAFFMEQDHVDLDVALRESKRYEGFDNIRGDHHSLLDEALNSLEQR